MEDAEKRWVAAKENFGEGHLHEMTCAQGVAMALNNLALALKGRGDTAGAEPLLRRALEVYQNDVDAYLFSSWVLSRFLF